MLKCLDEFASRFVFAESLVDDAIRSSRLLERY